MQKQRNEMAGINQVLTSQNFDKTTGHDLRTAQRYASPEYLSNGGQEYLVLWKSMLTQSMIGRALSLADTGKLLAEHHVQHPGAAYSGLHEHHSWVICHHFADDGRVFAECMFPHLL